SLVKDSFEFFHELVERDVFVARHIGLDRNDRRILEIGVAIVLVPLEPHDDDELLRYADRRREKPGIAIERDRPFDALRLRRRQGIDDLLDELRELRRDHLLLERA